MLKNDQLDQWDRENFFHPSTHLAQFARGEAPNRIITGGEGVYIEDRDGNRLLDGFAGLYCVNVGYGRTKVTDAIARQAKELAYYHAYVGHGTEASITLSKMVIERAPKNMSKVYFGLSGSDANETNIKLVWYYNNVLGRPEKKKIISRWRGYHGSGLMTGSLTGLGLFHKKFDLPLSNVIHTEAPYYFRRGDVRGEGLLLAVEFVEDKKLRKLFDPALTMGVKANAALMKRGVISRAMPEGDILGFAPPLCLSKEEADTIVGAMAETVQDVFS